MFTVAGINVLRFFMSPAGKLMLVIAAFLAWGQYQRVDATVDCRNAQELILKKQAEQQQQEAARILQEARERADDTEKENERLRQVANEIREKLSSDRDDRCDIPDDVRQRLLEIK